MLGVAVLMQVAAAPAPVVRASPGPPPVVQTPPVQVSTALATPAVPVPTRTPASPASPPAAAPTDLTPEARAAGLAGITFPVACLQRLGVAASPAEFARSSDGLGAALRRDHPEETAVVKLDGAEGRGCRVRYSGPLTDRMWTAWNGVLGVMAPTPDGGGCRAQESTSTHIRLVCVDTAPKPPRRAEVVIEREGEGAAASVTASVLPTAPTP